MHRVAVRSPWRIAAPLLAAGLVILLPRGVTLRAQQTTFREAVDVIEFDVRVVDGKGLPMRALKPDQFQVSLDGQNRRVMSADLVEYGKNVPASAQRANEPASIWPAPQSLRLTDASHRTFVLVIDAASFDIGSARDVVDAARRFVQGLRTEDAVGLYVFPTGSQISPTTDRGRILTALQRVTGEQATPPGLEFNLRPSELVTLTPSIGEDHPAWDIALDPGRQLREVREDDVLIAKFCGPDRTTGVVIIDVPCYRRLQGETATMTVQYERDAQQILNLLHSLIRNLAEVPGRKTLIMASGGVVTAARPGMRPNIGTLDVTIGEEAIKTNTSIYTLFVDWRATQQFSTEQRRARNTLKALSEDSLLLSRALEQFSGAAGGTLFKALSGTEVAFDRVLNETSTYYVLGVQPAAGDRDGKPHQLTVKVRQSGATVRGNKWVTVDRR